MPYFTASAKHRGVAVAWVGHAPIYVQNIGNMLIEIIQWSRDSACVPKKPDCLPILLISVCSGCLAHRCDGAHKTTTLKPVVVQVRAGEAGVGADNKKTLWMCGCKHSKEPPFCDGSHNALA